MSEVSETDPKVPERDQPQTDNDRTDSRPEKSEDGSEAPPEQ